MTGELALARHVPCAATRNREPWSNPPLGATLVATITPRPIWPWRSSHSAEPNATDLRASIAHRLRVSS